MSNTVFIAVQCCQCSIMQVKQKKKSSNKWTCVVCNQKQSVRKVFAQGYMAKDLRQFVQAFNMSQSQQPHKGDGFEPSFEMEMPNKKPELNNYPTTGEEESQDDEEPRTCQAKMTNAASKWSHYMTQDDMEQRTFQPKKTNSESKLSGYLTQDVVEPSICQRKKTDGISKWNKYMTEDMEPRTSQPTMTKAASSRSNYTAQDDKEPTACHTTTEGVSKWGDYITEDEKEQGPPLPKWRDYIKEDEKGQGTRAPTIGKATSKWNDYLTQGEDELQPIKRRIFADRMVEWSNGVFETITCDQKVEDDIHPDFI